MNLFEKALLKENKELCLYCHQPHQPDKRNQSRGWGLFCSKSCAVKWRNNSNRVSKSEKTQLTRELKLKQIGI